MERRKVVLQKLGDLPHHLQFNRYILKGYRPLLNAKDCLKSLFYLHNETFNVYSHLLAFVYFTATAPSTYGQTWGRAGLQVRAFILINLLISTLPFLASFVYHLFMPHHGGAGVYRWLLKIDVLGVWLITSLGAVPQLWTVTHCHATIQPCATLLYFCVSLISLWIILAYDTAVHRVMALTLQYLFRVGFGVFRFCPLSGGHPSGVLLMAVVDLLAAPGALVNGLKLPERRFPGRCDYLGNGHTIMHVASFVVILVSQKSLLLDLESYLSTPCPGKVP